MGDKDRQERFKIVASEYLSVGDVEERYIKNAIEYQVNELLNNGWELHGELFADPGMKATGLAGSGKPRYVQAMTRSRK